jgi:ferric-dicitrate binding protein FerR (iron transport regulator)
LDQAIRWIVENSDPNVSRRTIEFKAWVSESPLHRKVYVWMRQMQQSYAHMGSNLNWLTADVVPLSVHWEQRLAEADDICRARSCTASSEPGRRLPGDVVE